LGAAYYAWDVWFLYGPDAKWEGDIPPKPLFWMHQLHGDVFTAEKYLDVDVFVKKINEQLEKLPNKEKQKHTVALYQNPEQKSIAIQKDNELIWVDQPLGVVLSKNIIARGTYKTIRNVQSISMKDILLSTVNLIH